MYAHQCPSCGRNIRLYWKLHQHLKRCPSHHAAAVVMWHASDFMNTEHHAARATTADVLVLGSSMTTPVAQNALLGQGFPGEHEQCPTRTPVERS